MLTGTYLPDPYPIFEPVSEPQKIPVPQIDNGDPIDGTDIATGVAVGVGAVGAGYVAYRVVRMIPSLLPPLWWTIPANAALP